MRLRTLLLTTTCFLGVGCAADPARDVRDAQRARTEETRDYEVRNAELAGTEIKKPGDTDIPDKRAEVDSDHEKNMATKDRDVSDAVTKMRAERRMFDAKVEEREGKSDAKAEELRDKSTRVNAAKRAQFEPLWSDYITKRDAAARQRSLLSTVADDGWYSAKRDMDQALDALEKSVDSLKKPF